jgi:hypothetical protein
MMKATVDRDLSTWLKKKGYERDGQRKYNSESPAESI